MVLIDFRSNSGIPLTDAVKLRRYIKLCNDHMREQVEDIVGYNDPNWNDLVVFLKKICTMNSRDIPRLYEHRDFLVLASERLKGVIEVLPLVFDHKEYQDTVRDALTSFRGCLDIQERIEKADIRPSVLYGCMDNIDLLYTLTVDYVSSYTNKEKGVVDVDKE